MMEILHVTFEDALIEYMYFSFIPLAIQMALIIINVFVLKNTSEYFVIIQGILWIMLSWVAPTVFLNLVLLEYSSWYVGLVGLFLMFVQISINIEYLMSQHKMNKRKR